MAAQEFRHSLQHHLPSSYNAWTRRCSDEFPWRRLTTREALLYSQLYDGLRYDLMHGPAVSGARDYKELCVAAKGEEYQRQQRLKTAEETTSRSKRMSTTPYRPCRSSGPGPDATLSQAHRQAPPDPPVGSLASDRHLLRVGVGWRVHPQQGSQSGPTACYLETLLFSDSVGETTNAYTVQVSDGGSICQCAKVQVLGVPAYTGANITIISGKLFKRVATVAHIKRRNFKKADKVPRTYDQKTFRLDGKMDLDIAFEGKTMCTRVYIKMDPPTNSHSQKVSVASWGLSPSTPRWRNGGEVYI